MLSRKFNASIHGFIIHINFKQVSQFEFLFKQQKQKAVLFQKEALERDDE